MRRGYDQSLMDLLDQMTTFVRVVEGGSLAAAARSLNRSVPALSRQLSALEHELGVPLIVRSTRRHQVTDAGQVWYQRSKTILEEVEAARRSARPGSVQGRLTVSAPITVGLHCVVPALGKLMSQYPKLKVEVSLDDGLVDLVASGVDVVVRAGAPLGESTSLIARPLMSFQRVAVASPAWLSTHSTPTSPAALAQHDCLVQLGGEGPISTWRFERGQALRTVDVKSRLALTAPIALRDLAVAGLGVAWLAEWLVQADLSAGRLVQLFPGWSSAPLTVWALFRVELRAAERVRAFVEALRASVDPQRAE
jgi:DNA-binding transcriptional LysR family regulator